jgi:signal peptidase I
VTALTAALGRPVRVAVSWAEPARTVAVWFIAGLIGAALLVLSLGRLFGYQPLIVSSAGMQPTIAGGDLVLTREIRPLEARIGDVVSYRDRRHAGRLVTQRVRAVRPHGRMVRLVTKGDANIALERWSVPITGRVGRVEYRVPAVGPLVGWLGDGGRRLFLLLGSGVLLLGLELGVRSRTRREGSP